MASSSSSASVEAQVEAVRSIKASPGASQFEMDMAVESPKGLKLEVAARQAEVNRKEDGATSELINDALRQAVVNILERRLFIIPSFKIYRGVAGLYDYGPPGCAVKSNVLTLWRQVNFFLYTLITRAFLKLLMICFCFLFFMFFLDFGVWDFNVFLVASLKP